MRFTASDQKPVTNFGGLKKPGWIALFNYTFTNTVYLEMLSAKLATMKSMSSRIDQAWHRMPIQVLFGEGQIQTLSYLQSHTEDWTAFFGAACAGLEAPERGDRDFGQFEALNCEVFDAFAVNGKIQIDYETQVSYGRPIFR